MRNDYKIRILLADDEEKFLNAMAQRFSLRGFVTATAVNGADALKLAEASEFDVAIVDLKMPGLDGVEVAKEIKTSNPFCETIILTGHGSPETAVECEKLGVYAYLPKPYEFEKLLESVYGAFDSARIKKARATN